MARRAESLQEEGGDRGRHRTAKMERRPVEGTAGEVGQDISDHFRHIQTQFRPVRVTQLPASLVTAAAVVGGHAATMQTPCIVLTAHGARVFPDCQEYAMMCVTHNLSDFQTIEELLTHVYSLKSKLRVATSRNSNFRLLCKCYVSVYGSNVHDMTDAINSIIRDDVPQDAGILEDDEVAEDHAEAIGHNIDVQSAKTSLRGMQEVTKNRCSGEKCAKFEQCIPENCDENTVVNGVGAETYLKRTGCSTYSSCMKERWDIVGGSEAYCSEWREWE
ncbi:hypothetical protein LXA43DRAFT_1066256 [Ganoderma leucocontextum]|nr:hypothetical protein LXA43DRAFT_1066256 [Ganoderma leucocontextum]